MHVAADVAAFVSDIGPDVETSSNDVVEEMDASQAMSQAMLTQRKYMGHDVATTETDVGPDMCCNRRVPMCADINIGYVAMCSRQQS